MQVVNREITKIVPEDKLTEIAASYKLKFLKTRKRPGLWEIFRENYCTRKQFNLVIGLLGGPVRLHEYLAKTVDILNDNFEELLQVTISETKARVPDMSNVELINLVNALSKLTPQQSNTQVNNNIVFDINEHLADRL